MAGPEDQQLAHAAQIRDRTENRSENAELSKRTRTAALEHSALVVEAAAKRARKSPEKGLIEAPLIQAATKTAALAGDWSATQRDVRINIFAGEKAVQAVEIQSSAERIESQE